jgi:hypothetical protein
MRVLARHIVPCALLRDEPARRGFIDAMRARAALHTKEGVRVRVRYPLDHELLPFIPLWRVPFIAARRTRVIIEVVTS